MARKINSFLSTLNKYSILMLQFDKSKNLPFLITDNLSMTERLWWLCPVCAYSWQNSVRKRADHLATTETKESCPRCSKVRSGRQRTKPQFGKSLFEDADLLQEYTGERDPKTIHIGTKALLPWRCKDCSCPWEATAQNRSSGNTGCPDCAYLKRGLKNSLPRQGDSLAENLTLLPEYTGEKDPTTIRVGTKDALPWRCLAPFCGNAWRASGHNRVRHSSGCPRCKRIYSAAEHLSNHYLLAILGANSVNIESGEASKVRHESSPYAFQIDARIKVQDKLIAYLYDGGGGHNDSEESTSFDIRRREALSGVPLVYAVVAHRHGMNSLNADIQAKNYVDHVTPASSSILKGVVGTLTAMFERMPELASQLPLEIPDLETVYAAATISWNALPKANPHKFNACLIRERKALALEIEHASHGIGT